MFQLNMLKTFIVNVLILVLFFVVSGTACGSELTQKAWLVTLVDSLGWSFGLPDEPEDSDYFNIVSGNRKLQIEAEDVYAKEKDNVSLMAYKNFGEFSGEGWLKGARNATDVHLNFLLPVSGTYRVTAKLLKAGHRIKIGEKTFPADPGPIFTDIEIANIQFDAGPQEIVVTLPPGGAIDSLSLTAPNHLPISPANGWKLEDSLTWDVINQTLLQLWQLSEVFPLSGESHILEAEDYQQEGNSVVDIPHLGLPSAGKWLKSGTSQSTVTIPVELLESGHYSLSARIIRSPIQIIVDNHFDMTLAGKPYLEDFPLPAYYFDNSSSNIEILLPPSGGLDRVMLSRYLVDTSRCSEIFDIDQSSQPTNKDLDHLAELMAAFGSNR